MEVNLIASLLPGSQQQEAQRILRSCVHCGFCTATCPTYAELGDDLDSPRGRIYQMKAMFEGHAPTRNTQVHLDRCLSCSNCVTACPSGVDYHHLIDIGREYVEAKVRRPWRERVVRWGLRRVVPNAKWFAALVGAGRLVRPLLPATLREHVPPRPRSFIRQQTKTAAQTYARKVILPRGCVQPSLTPATNAAAVRVLNALGIGVVQSTGCCGAVSQHLSAGEDARAMMKKNIDQWLPLVDSGAEAIVITASGCGVQVKNYGYLLQDDPAYAAKAKRISSLCRDLCEVIGVDDVKKLAADKAAMAGKPRRIAFHTPCTLQHGQGLGGKTEQLLAAAGYELLPVAGGAQGCCGSAGTYSILQSGLSKKIRAKKLVALEQHRPDAIATANVGCQTHLQQATATPVHHWIELLVP